MMEDKIFSGKFYYFGTFQDLFVYVKNGVITDVRKFEKSVKTERIEGAILPGFFDAHVHFRDPGETDKEDFYTGSMSSVFGGTTTVLDMPNNIIPIRDYNQFDRKKAVVKGRSFTDYGLFSLYDGTNGDVISKESIGLKIFMGESTNSTAFTGDYEHDQFLEKYSRPVVFHGESAECLRKNSAREVKTLIDHDSSRPSSCEMEALRTISKLKTSVKIAAHISDYGNAQSFPEKFFMEVTPHHILLNEEMQLGAYGKVNPPLREKAVMEKTREAYLDGKFDLLSSDHAPHLEKDKESIQFGKSGIIGVETRVPLMLALVHKKILSLDTLLKTGASRPAELFGIKKGKIEKGYSADFVSVNFSDMEKLNENRLHSKLTISPFNGFDVVFPRNVFVRGEKVISNREIIEDCLGNMITPQVA
ncbi:dihydroorotase [Cuniculiplasma divulgatum]|jgi:dihydroorotase|uniref:Dihydroorotase n=1 Tax=Cuniculiplasma divulgatum TaxID=1673428 RepID=A0A1R4A6K0_9ARCH|nr:dihydroorotase [Cuniculiplasma divulgatum]MCI2411718.1 dihydroorotase [Cuniculiplasma sp.]SJK84607.1 dihydroorotase [Cuniculiplasma divulgatum]